MSAKIVERAEMPPAKCAVTGDIDGPFIDTGAWCPNVDPYIYLHVPYVEQLAREVLGMVSQDEVEELRKKVAELTAKVEKLGEYGEALAKIEELEQEVAA